MALAGRALVPVLERLAIRRPPDYGSALGGGLAAFPAGTETWVPAARP
jgi:hypothetical protein